MEKLRYKYRLKKENLILDGLCLLTFMIKMLYSKNKNAEQPIFLCDKAIHLRPKIENNTKKI